MTITNIAKPSANSMTNAARSLSGETWASISTTWASETRTWAATASFLTNVSRVSASMTNTAKP